jgi:hypothetical protein
MAQEENKPTVKAMTMTTFQKEQKEGAHPAMLFFTQIAYYKTPTSYWIYLDVLSSGRTCAEEIERARKVCAMIARRKAAASINVRKTHRLDNLIT